MYRAQCFEDQKVKLFQNPNLAVSFVWAINQTWQENLTNYTNKLRRLFHSLTFSGDAIWVDRLVQDNPS